MGSLALPAAGSVYVDAQAIIYSVQRHPVYSPLLLPLWRAESAGRLIVLTSQLSLLECLVGPLQWNDAALLADFEAFFQTPGIVSLPLDETVLRRAAMLRAKHKPLRTPDAIHAATSMIAGALQFVTNDRQLRAVSGLPVAILDAAVSGP